MKHDILLTDEPIMLQITTSGPWGKGHETVNFTGQDAKAQGHERPKLDLGRHNS